MILPDINLLLYATYQSFAEHEEAKKWWDGALSSSQVVLLGHVVVLGFIRLATNAKIFDGAMTTDEAIDVVDSWLAQPNVSWATPAADHWSNWKDTLRLGAASSLSTDAHIAALAADYGVPVYSTDSDFLRFKNIRHINPIS